MTTMQQAMPEATVLYTVTAVVVVGLVVWVALVLKTATAPWSRAVLPRLEPGDEAGVDADTTAKATPVALSTARKSIADADEAKPDA